MAEKIDFKKDYKELYTAPTKGFATVDVPRLRFLMIDGAGDPNTVPEFEKAIQALYTVAYTIKFSAKKAGIGPEYGVPPLEGLWWCEGMEGFDYEDRTRWRWTLMIAQPAHVSGEMVKSAVEQSIEKGKMDTGTAVRLEAFDEGLCVQAMHIGPYSEEGPRICAMHRFIAENGYGLRGRHHEIYIGDPRRSSPEKLKTILRHPVSRVS